MNNCSIYDFCLYLIFGFVSVSVLYKQIKLFKDFLFLKKYGVRTNGIVISNNETIHENGEKMNRPTLSFKDTSNNDIQVEFPDSYNSRILNNEIGKQFALIYDAERPEKYIINEIKFFVFPIGTGLVMFCLLINSIYNLILNYPCFITLLNIH